MALSQKERSRNYYITHTEELKEKARTEWFKYKERIQKTRKERIAKVGVDLRERFRGWKKGAKFRKIDFDLTFEDIKNLPFICHYTGLELTLKRNQSNTVSLDRIDSNKGYSKENIVLCCSLVNLMKHKSTVEDLYKWCDLILKGRK